MILTDSDLKNEAKNKNVEDLDIFDFKESDIKFDMIRFFRWIRYVGDKGVKVIKEYGGDEIEPFISFTERQDVALGERSELSCPPSSGSTSDGFQIQYNEASLSMVQIIDGKGMGLTFNREKLPWLIQTLSEAHLQMEEEFHKSHPQT